METFNLISGIKETLRLSGLAFSEEKHNSVCMDNWHLLSYREQNLKLNPKENSAKMKENTYINNQHNKSDTNINIVNTIKYSNLSDDDIQIFIRTVDDKTLTVTINKYDSIECLKRKINVSQNIELDDQRLFYGGKQLEDKRSLHDYNINKGNTLHLVLTLKGGCFIGETQILISDRTVKAIKTVKLGDMVLSWAIEKSEPVSKKVTKIYKKFSNQMIKITYENGNSVTCTKSHPFYIKDNGWSALDNETASRNIKCNVSLLKIGSELLLNDGSHVKIKEIESLNDDQLTDVYNLEIEDTHNYFAEGVLVHNGSGEIFNRFNLNQIILDPIYDYDFSNIDDKGNKFKRGGLDYYRPCGSERFALKVLGRYEDDNWITSSDSWVNAYHGTLCDNLKPIIDKGLKVGGTEGIKILNGAIFGSGIYLSPFPEYSLNYAPEFEQNGKKYKIIFQCRVKPKSFTKHDPNYERNGEENIWVVKDINCVRPYSICVYEICKYSTTKLKNPNGFMRKDRIIKYVNNN